VRDQPQPDQHLSALEELARLLLAEGPLDELLDQLVAVVAAAVPAAEAVTATVEVDDGRLTATFPSDLDGGRATGDDDVLVVPLSAAGELVGRLEVYGREVPVAQRELARRLAEPIGATLANARAYRRVTRLATQLQEALESRAVIERAKGVLMATTGVDETAAFEALRRRSQDENRKLRDVARDLVGGRDDAAADPPD
jgi:nitrate/nitrite-specific signal transduction histidine kinase